MLLEEYKRLVDTIDYHMDKYYNEDEPEISDFEYDQLMQQLKAAEKEHPEWVTPDSPTQKITPNPLLTLEPSFQLPSL